MKQGNLPIDAYRPYKLCKTLEKFSGCLYKALRKSSKNFVGTKFAKHFRLVTMKHKKFDRKSGKNFVHTKFAKLFRLII